MAGWEQRFSEGGWEVVVGERGGRWSAGGGGAQRGCGAVQDPGQEPAEEGLCLSLSQPACERDLGQPTGSCLSEGDEGGSDFTGHVRVAEGRGVRSRVRGNRASHVPGFPTGVTLVPNTLWQTSRGPLGVAGAWSRPLSGSGPPTRAPWDRMFWKHLPAFPAWDPGARRPLAPGLRSPDEDEVDLGVGRVALQLYQEDKQQGTQEVDQGDDPRGQVLEQHKQGLLP